VSLKLLNAGIIVAASAVALIISACGGQQVSDSEVTAEEIARVKAVGEVAAAELAQTLKAALTEAMQEGGLEGAIRVCNVKAASLTESIAEQSESIESVKRTSFKYRNPANAPDSLEEAALRHFEETLQSTGELPAFHVQKFDAGQATHFRYYQPLKVGGLCLACHGGTDVIAPAVAALLAQHYPNDRAVGYRVGDFRGVIRVSVADSR
jgi:hypothetical protein